MKDGRFFVQMHMHTSETSRCGAASGRDMARAAKDAGYDMIVVTDHFFNANIGCSRKLPWEEKVEYLQKGYRAAKEEGDHLGLKVLFGWETNTGGPEVLTYGLDSEFLLSNPDVTHWSLSEYIVRTNRAGAFNAHAHPFREAYYIPPFTPDPALYEAFEVFNACNEESWNQRAQRMAERFDLIQIAGSDAHETRLIRFGAMSFPEPLEDMKDLIAALRAYKGRIVREMQP